MIACIMQPTYLPWMGYFDLIAQSDVFVFLDTVSFSRQSWQQRNRIATPQGPRWLTVPVLYHRDQAITDVQIDNTKPWRRKHWASLVMNYSRAPFWLEYLPVIESIYAREWSSLPQLNIAIIEALCDLAGITAEFVLASALGPVSADREGKLVEICRRLGAETYLSPIGSISYLQTDAAFVAGGIALEFHTFDHPTYVQPGSSFESHLSFLDALVNVGPDAARLMERGRGPARSLAEVHASEAPGPEPPDGDRYAAPR